MEDYGWFDFREEGIDGGGGGDVELVIGDSR